MTSMLKLDDLFMTYGDEKYAELGVFLDLLRSLRLIHHINHWQVKGHTAYSDHLLFQRLYEGIDPQVDMVGEKAVALGSSELVKAGHFLENSPRFILSVDMATETPVIENMGGNPLVAPGRSSDKLVKKSLVAEKSFITAGERLMDQLKSKKLLTRGLEQLLGTILDEHETFVYLLKQRSAID